MKALILSGPNQLIYDDVPDPDIGPDEVLVRVKACAICGSDVHGMDGSTGRRIPPVVMGHEASGVVHELGKDVQGFQVGQRVTFDSTIYCGACPFCREGHRNLCENRRVLGVSCPEYRRAGALADLISLPQHILYPLPPAVSFEQAALTEPLSIALHALRRSRASLNCAAVVVGAGAIGLLLVCLLKAAGCRSVFAVDRFEERLEKARTMGADIVLKADDPQLAGKVHEQTAKRGADVSFEVVGTSPAMQVAVAVLRKGGSMTVIGNVAPTVSFPLQSVVTREIDVHTSCASSGEYQDCIGMIAEGRVDVRSLISATAPLSEGSHWFGRLHEGDPGLVKVILRP